MQYWRYTKSYLLFIWNSNSAGCSVLYLATLKGKTFWETSWNVSLTQLFRGWMGAFIHLFLSPLVKIVLWYVKSSIRLAVYKVQNNYTKKVFISCSITKVSHAHLHLASPWSVRVQWTSKWIIETYTCSLSFLGICVLQTSLRSYNRPSWLHFSSSCCDGDAFCLVLAGFMKVPAPWLRPPWLALPSPRFSDAQWVWEPCVNLMRSLTSTIRSVEEIPCNMEPLSDEDRYPSTQPLTRWFQDPTHQFSSVTQLCLTLCNPIDCSTAGFPVHHQLPEFTQTHVHRVSDASQPSHPLLILRRSYLLGLSNKVQHTWVNLNFSQRNGGSVS